MKTGRRAHLAVFVPDLQAGGVARFAVTLTAAFAGRGHRMDLVVCGATGPFLGQVPDSVNLVELRRSWLFPAGFVAAAPMSLPALGLHCLRSGRPLPNLSRLPALARYLRRERPHALLSAKTYANLVAVWAARLAGAPTRIVISEHTHLSSVAKHEDRRSLAPLVRRTYPRADVKVGVSDGVAADLSRFAGMPHHEIVTAYSVGAAWLPEPETGEGPLAHAWFQPDAPPVILGAGRLVRQKDFATLLRAFAHVRARRRARLVVLGEGPLRSDLEALARALGIAADLDMPGFVSNPRAWMARAAVFALSSAWEGLPAVLIESLAVGCPVVSTDCPSGPAEILDGGAYGRLVPVGDDEALAKAIVATLDDPPPRDLLRLRARHFSTDRMIGRYLDILLGERP